MIAFYKEPSRRSARVRAKSQDIEITDLDIKGCGVGKSNGKACFVSGALPGELVRITPFDHGRIIKGELIKVLRSSELRREPFCPVQEQCGGCPLYYIDPGDALRFRLAGIRQLFRKNSGYELGEPDFTGQGSGMHYRRSARLAVGFQGKKAYVGFREGKSHSVVPVSSCQILTPRLNELLPGLDDVLNRLDDKKALGHADLADGDSTAGVSLRVTRELDDHDRTLLADFAREHGIYLSLIAPKHSGGDVFVYQGPEDYDQREEVEEKTLYAPGDLYVTSDGLRLNFTPAAFVQVNREVNEMMVTKLLEYSGVDEGYGVLDLFCGFGNFSFALAKRANFVVGADINSDMISTARDNASALGFSNLYFINLNLDVPSSIREQHWERENFDLAVLDPGRAGALNAVKEIAALRIKRVVMCSCSPGSASRDSSVLSRAGYELEKYAVFDMFAYTSHIEMMMVFTLQ